MAPSLLIVVGLALLVAKGLADVHAGRALHVPVVRSQNCEASLAESLWSRPPSA
jgi:hypothetical protein